MDVYQRLGVRTIVNARGYFTMAGGTLMDDETLAAYLDAARSFVRIEDLQLAAGRVISEVTGAEGGYVTSGAAAAVTIASAACLARLDVDVMETLPQLDVHPDEVVIQRCHRDGYDHMVRAAGARLVEFGDADGASAEAMQAAIGGRTVAAFYQGGREHVGMSSAEFVTVAHEAGLPVIVDAAISLPPAANLRRFVSEGADLVAFSGGKAIRGPQGTGFLAGRRDLLLSVALQHQDMDVVAETWSRRTLIEQGILPRPPQHGIGRSMKVGKEDIAALLAALRQYVERDHDAEARSWMNRASALADTLGDIAGLAVTVQEHQALRGRPIPQVSVRVDSQTFGCPAAELVRRLADQDPRVLVNDDEVALGVVGLDVENLRQQDLPTVSTAFRAVATDVQRAGSRHGVVRGG